MSTKEWKEHLKRNIDKLSASDTKLAVKDLGLYFEYLQNRRQLPKNIKFSFEQYQQLTRSLQQADKDNLISSKKVFADIKKKYGLGN